MTIARHVGLPSLAHLLTLTDDCGVIQHATCDVPNRLTGYCVDDVARAFVVTARMPAAGNKVLALRALSFLHHAQRDDGRFHNFMSYDRRWLDEVGSEDAFGRALWALGWGIAVARERSWSTLCRGMLDLALPHVESLRNLRPKAYAALGLAAALSADGPASAGDTRIALAGTLRMLIDAYRREGDDRWRWFEPTMTYANARLSEALVRGGAALQDGEAMEVGLETLAFLESVTMEGDIFVPIGNAGWYPRGGERAVYAQQPIEAAAMVEAELAAYDATRRDRHYHAAGVAYDWFFGHNLGGAVMVQGGGCRDGLEAGYVNGNMGAESTLSYLMASIAMASHSEEQQRGVRR